MYAGVFEDYSADQNLELEIARMDGLPYTTFQRKGMKYKVDLHLMEQVNVMTGTKRPVKRVTPQQVTAAHDQGDPFPDTFSFGDDGTIPKNVSVSVNVYEHEHLERSVTQWLKKALQRNIIKEEVWLSLMMLQD